MRCLGTNLHLKNKYGSGYKIDIRFDPDKAAEADAFVMQVVPFAKLETHFGDQRTYQVHKDDVQLSHVFQEMLNRPADVGIKDYGVRQTSLEEVFIKIAKESEEAF